MLRILFFLLSIISLLELQAGAIEIFVNGHKYDSIDAYQESKRLAVAPARPSLVPLNNQQEDYIRHAAKKLGINVDFSKVKTFQVNQNNISNETQHKLYVLSVENGVVGALHNFYQNWGQADLRMPSKVSSEDLQGVIEQAVGKSKVPKLLISQPGKVRIMALTTDEAQK